MQIEAPRWGQRHAGCQRERCFVKYLHVPATLICLQTALLAPIQCGCLTVWDAQHRCPPLDVHIWRHLAAGGVAAELAAGLDCSSAAGRLICCRRLGMIFVVLCVGLVAWLTPGWSRGGCQLACRPPATRAPLSDITVQRPRWQPTAHFSPGNNSVLVT